MMGGVASASGRIDGSCFVSSGSAAVGKRFTLCSGCWLSVSCFAATGGSVLTAANVPSVGIAGTVPEAIAEVETETETEADVDAETGGGTGGGAEGGAGGMGAE